MFGRNKIISTNFSTPRNRLLVWRVLRRPSFHFYSHSVGTKDSVGGGLKLQGLNRKEGQSWVLVEMGSTGMSRPNRNYLLIGREREF